MDNTIILFWVGIAAGFAIIEMITSTFYGLSLSLASMILVAYVSFVGDADFTMIQAGIFVIASALFAYFLPKILRSTLPDMPQGSDRYIGEKRSAKKTGGDLKIPLDGVEYLIDSDDDIAPGDKVEVIGHKGASMKVKKVIVKK